MLIFTAPQREFVFMTVFLQAEAINESELKQGKSTAKPKLLPTTEQPDSTEPSDGTWANLVCTEPKCQTCLWYYSSFLAILTRGKYHKAVGFWKDSHYEQHNSPQWDTWLLCSPCCPGSDDSLGQGHWAQWAVPVLVHSPNTACWERELWQCSCDVIVGN